VAGLDQNRMLEAVKPSAERRARAKLILERLAAQENVAIDDAELEAGLERIAARSGRDVAQVRQFYQENDLLEALRRQLQDEKTLKLLVDQADIKVPETPAPQEQE
jgi:trigger factor